MRILADSYGGIYTQMDRLNLLQEYVSVEKNIGTVIWMGIQMIVR